MGGRKQRSAVDAGMTLLSDIELNKTDRKLTSCLMMDVKGAFDFVNKNQLLQTCQKNNLSSSLCQWIDSFLQSRKMKLAFDDETTQSFDVDVGVPQGSPVSPILFLIYISELFKQNHYLTREFSVRLISYIDDIAIVASSKTFHENCRILKKIASKLIDWGNNHFVQFDMKKTELIHFDSSHRATSASNSVKLTNDLIIEPQEYIRWLGIWFDRKLTFKIHVEKRTASAIRMFHSISRLASTVRGLSFQAMRKLYIACIASISDFGVPIWWKQQKHLLEKFNKIQNQALRKILGAFKHSPLDGLEIEACLPPSKIRLNKLCENYALRIIKLNDSHPVKQRVSQTFPNNLNGIEFKNSKTIDWNQKEILSESESEIENSQRRNVRRTKKIKRKFHSQLIRICSMIQDIIPDQMIEKFSPNWSSPWKKSRIDFDVNSSSKTKIEAADKHQKLISSLKKSHHNNIIIYSDGSKLSNSDAGAGSFISYEFNDQKSYSWNLNSSSEIFDLEIFAISESLSKIDEKITDDSIFLTDIYVFADSLGAIQRIQNNSQSSGQEWVAKIHSKAEFLFHQNIKLHIHWVPGHMDIHGNEMADLAAKTGAYDLKSEVVSYQMPVSLISLKRKLKERQLLDWQSHWTNSKKKGRTYQNLNTFPAWKSINSSIKTSRVVWSSYIQLKMGHGFFLSYLFRLPAYDSNKCDCDDLSVQSPAHILLDCEYYDDFRENWRQKIDVTMSDLLCTKRGVHLILDFLSKTEIVRWSWFQ